MRNDISVGQVLKGQRAESAAFLLNIPNSLTILRILLVPVLVGLMVYGHYDYALVTLLVAALTDGLDGTIARMANQRTQLGAYLDPLADKLLIMSTFVTFAVLGLVPVWSVILVVSRDAILLTGTLLARMTETALNVAPTLLGKATTVSQLAYIILVVGLNARHTDVLVLNPLLYGMSALTVISGFHYIARGLSQFNFPQGTS
ncbi:MAG: CDP-alcohol phosphatidyltransferase family protein [Nitrospirae bacterium]|nr:MAG: CDP-alcohol phosphatidyltransferase family protein [Nitrospirota bacterium]